ncbi:MAG: galactose mutarotase [Lachnospiraceae bacterium]|nr:galactose mutarotase [Lachnospiraceae bacterium]
MAVEKSVFGKSPKGQEVYLYTLSNSKGMQAAVTNVGAALVKLMVPDREGKLADVVLGFDKAEDYYQNSSFFGVVVGPSANRIAGASFEIDGTTYQLDDNDNENNLHSHQDNGYHKQYWEAVMDENSVTFTLEDVDGNMGFPGNKRISVTYTLSEDNALRLHYQGCSDKKTIFNLTNHTYFNLEGHNAGCIEEHLLKLNASNYTPVVAGAIPTGEIATVSNTPMDFTQLKKVGLEIGADFEQLLLTGGYDHNWVIDDWNGKLREFATVQAPISGRVMKAFTTLPGVQFYAGNFVDDQIGKDGVSYSKRHGLCLETQYYPDTIHHENFPSCVFGKDKEYDSITVYQFE